MLRLKRNLCRVGCKFLREELVRGDLLMFSNCESLGNLQISNVSFIVHNIIEIVVG